jgi:hypothetical protein
MTADIGVSFRNIRHVGRPADLMCKELYHTYIVLCAAIRINLAE